MTHAIPGIRLNDGNTIPQLGFGVWQVANDEVASVIKVALDAGYRAIDTAQGYNNEEGVGRAIREHGRRDELYITSKLRTRDQGFDDALRAFDGTLKRLGLDVLDLFLIHWPIPAANKYPEAWKAFVRLQKEGRVRSIGVSNFLPEHLERVIGETGVTPAVNQIELHPEYQQRNVRELHNRLGIVIESYSPLGNGQVIGNPKIGEIARKHGRSPAQTILRWLLQQDLVIIPKSVTPDRIRQNIDIFDFELDQEDMDTIAALDRPQDGKRGNNPATNNAIW